MLLICNYYRNLKKNWPKKGIQQNTQGTFQYLLLKRAVPLRSITFLKTKILLLLLPLPFLPLHLFLISLELLGVITGHGVQGSFRIEINNLRRLLIPMILLLSKSCFSLGSNAIDQFKYVGFH